MQSLGNVFTNSLEDSIDDLVSTFLFSEQKKINDALINNNSDLSLLDELKNNFIRSSLMCLTVWAYMHFMRILEFIITKLTLLWTYIASGKMLKKITSLKTKNIKGKKAINILKTILGADKTLERIEVAKLANSNIDSIQKEMQNIKNNKMQIENKMISIGATSAQLKNVSSVEDLNLYQYKTKTSTWQDTAKDKKLFEKITGEKISSSSGLTWSNLVEQLNKYSDFAKDTEDNVYNLTQAILRLISRSYTAK